MGGAAIFIVISSVDAVQPPFVIVHLKVIEEPTVRFVTVVV